MVQPSIDVALKQNTIEACAKMLKNAHELATNSIVPLKHFVILRGRDSNKSHGEYFHCLASAVREICAAIIVNQHFMSLILDRCQASKNGTNKELI